MVNSPINVLILSPGNSARSILGEALFNHLGEKRILAYSAGSHPTGRVDPLTIETLNHHGVPLPEMGNPRSKSWREFTEPTAPRLQYIITVGSSETIAPVLPGSFGSPLALSWEIPDPTQLEPPAARREAFEAAYLMLEIRIRCFLALPLEEMLPDEVRYEAQRIHIAIDR